MKKALWLIPEKSGGIRTYAERLLDALRSQAPTRWQIDEPLVFDSLDARENTHVFDVAKKTKPDLIHIQHEYGCFGKKYPLLARFQPWLKGLKAATPSSRVIVTAHTVISDQFSYGNSLLDSTLLPIMRPFWKTSSWRNLDGAIVHSRHQVDWLELDHGKEPVVIPHFAPELSNTPLAANPDPILLIFGYFSREKGQLVAIEAMKHVRSPLRLVMLGSVRREQDQKYFDACVEKIKILGLSERCEIISKYATFQELDQWYARSSLILAPFVSTTGSGSLVEAFSRRSAVIASDLLLNQEINERIPGCLELFKAGDAVECARKIDECFSNPVKLASLHQKAEEYARLFSLPKTAFAHLSYYDQVVSDR